MRAEITFVDVAASEYQSSIYFGSFVRLIFDELGTSFITAPNLGKGGALKTIFLNGNGSS